MKVFSHVMFGVVAWAARNGLAPESAEDRQRGAEESARGMRSRTGVRGETFAYWYLRRHGYIMVGRNFMVPGIKGEIDLIGYDGKILAFVEVKTRTGDSSASGLPEDAITPDKRRLVSRMARQFLAERRIRDAKYRFDVVAIESPSGRPPTIRLHKGAFS